MRISGFLLTIILLAVFLPSLRADDDPPGRVARLNYLNGEVAFQPGGVDDWVKAPLNRPLTAGDRLWTERDGRAELHIGTAALRLGPQTSFAFLNLDDQTAQIQLSQGSLVIRLRRLDENETFEVDTPNLAFSLLRPGEYRVDVNDDGNTTIVTVRGGEAEVTGGQAFQVHARQQARVTGGDSTGYDLRDAPPTDSFDEWCLSRDRREDRAESSRYVSREVIGYEDLDDYGDWRPVPEYGTVWAPRGVTGEWAPYRFGHWVWIEPWGWTWVDDAPWGFAPFHYGRWVYVGYWAWVPGPVVARPVYAPALVAWVGGPHFSAAISFGGGAGVAWFPLGPREVYVPSYRASERYVTRVNTTNTVINNINITNVYNNTNVTNVRYINQSAPGAVTAVNRETFVNARPVGQATVRVPRSAMEQVQVSRVAEVAPQRQSVLGRYAESPAPGRPSAAVIGRQVVARTPPPAAPVPFEARRKALNDKPGQPLDSGTIQTLRQNAPPVRPMVRQQDNVRPATPTTPVNPNPPARPGYQQRQRDAVRPTTPPAEAVRPVTPPASKERPRENIRPVTPPPDTVRPVTPPQERPRPANVERPRENPPQRESRQQEQRREPPKQDRKDETKKQ